MFHGLDNIQAYTAYSSPNSQGKLTATSKRNPCPVCDKNHEVNQKICPGSTPNFEEWLEKERMGSGIAPDLWNANVIGYQGEEAHKIIAGRKSDEIDDEIQAALNRQKQHIFWNREAALLRDRWKFILPGCWVATGWNGDEWAASPIIKPFMPRTDKEGKVIKYENLRGELCPPPFFAWVTYEYGLKIAQRLNRKELKAYQERMGSHNLEEIDLDFWEWVFERGWPVFITEGVKKALALISNGSVAIALRGISMFRAAKPYKGAPPSKKLHPSLSKLENCTVYIAHDEDSKPRTRTHVRRQSLQLGDLLKRSKNQVLILEWNAKRAKGIDDLLLASGESASEVINDLITNARTLDQYKADLGIILKEIDHLQSFSTVTPTLGDRLPTLPELREGQLLRLDGSMGTGKGVRVRADLIESAKEQERISIVICPNNNLGKQFAKLANLPHIHDFGTDLEQVNALRADLSYRGGAVLCLDSLARLLEIAPEIVKSKPLVILDEVNQVLENATNAGTLGNRQSEGLKAFCSLIQSAHSIAIAEEGVPLRCIELIQSARTSGAMSAFDVIEVVHRHSEKGGEVFMYKEKSRWYTELLSTVNDGKRRAIVFSSQTQAEKCHNAISKLNASLKVARIDSKTTELGAYKDFFADPDQWLRDNEIDLLIVSPTMASGVSIDGGKSINESYFAEIWGNFTHLAPSIHLQQLDRFRPPVPRHIYIPQSIQRTVEESSRKTWGLNHYHGNHAIFQARIHGLSKPSELSSFESQIQDFQSQATIVSGLQKSIAFEYLKHRLTEQGKSVQVLEGKGEKRITDLLKELQTEMEENEAIAIANVAIDPETDTPQWARSELASMSSTIATRRKANKILARERFPGIMFDNVEETMTITRKWGQIIKFVELRAAIENLDAVRSLERETVKNILGADYRVFHRLPKKGNRAEILRDIGILRLIESGEIYCYDTPLVKDIAEKAIARSQHIWQFFQLTVHDGLTSVEIVHKILKRLGYEIDKPNRPGAIHLAGRLGPIHNQVQYYQIVNHPEPKYETFLTAARQRLQAVAVISRGELDSLLETTAIPHNPVLEKVSEDTLPNRPLDHTLEEEKFYAIWKGDEEKSIDDDIGLKEIDD